MFSKILIANRGEIACRVARTARKLGIRTVAVHSEVDNHALHVHACDEAISIGGRTPAESYLDIDKILEAADKCGADAVHPGYGFLSENPMFSARCKDQGLTFIGPDAGTIRMMGQKDQARAIASQVAIPVLPGYEGERQDSETLYQKACEIGFPVLIKAVSGGGGKGMRTVNSKEEFKTALESVKRESLSAFADDRVLLEQYLPEARHVEVQIFADSHGNAVHLYERDCSLQRRHQKVVEEAPAPGLSTSTRKAMTGAAIACARAINYLGAGTVEFLLTPDQDFYFLEMNTRIQVEHPVTEMITGQDLVEWQFRVHDGEPVPLQQEQIALNGHAMEARLYAENPANHFLPASGKILRLQQPEPCCNIRIDTGIREGDTISAYYDPMISKLITWSTDRAGARILMRDALRDYVILGLPANTDFLQSLVDSPEFSAGEHHTRLIERNLETLLEGPQSSPLILCCAAAWHFLNALEYQRHRYCESHERYSPWLAHADFGVQEQRHYALWYRDEVGQQQELEFTHSQGHFVFARPRIQFPARLTDRLHMTVAHSGINGPITGVISDGMLHLHANGTHYRIDLLDSHQPVRTPEASDHALSAPLSGTVVDLKVECNQNVSEGETVMVIEAMKMEHHILAPWNGVVQDIHFGKGDRVTENASLLNIMKHDPK